MDIQTVKKYGIEKGYLYWKNWPNNFNIFFKIIINFI